MCAGQVWGVYNGLCRLEEHKSSFSALQNQVVFSFDQVRGASYCVRAELVNRMLEAVSQRGWAPFYNPENKSVERGITENVLAVVMTQAVAPLAPRAAFEKSWCVAVPASQAMRLLLALELKRYADQWDEKKRIM